MKQYKPLSLATWTLVSQKEQRRFAFFARTILKLVMVR